MIFEAQVTWDFACNTRPERPASRTFRYTLALGLKLISTVVERNRMAPLQRNARLVLDLLASESQGLTRTELRSRAGLSRPTVQSIVTELKEEGLIAKSGKATEGGSAGSQGGRKAERFVLAGSSGYVVGIDLGHGHARAAVADRSGHVLGEVAEDISIDVDKLGASALIRAAELIAKAVSSSGVSIDAVRSIGVGIPAAVDDNGLVLNSDSLPTWAAVPIASELHRLLKGAFPSLPLGEDMISVENDANLGALGEGLHGAAEGCRNYLYVKLSTGIGMGLVLGGHLYRGSNGAAGELGHVTVSSMGDRLIKSEITMPADVCPRCGKLDCLENVASSRAIVRQLRATKDAYAADLRVEDVIERATTEVANHPLCMQAIVNAGIRIGYTLNDIIRVYAPEMVVLGGLLAAAGNALVKPVEDAVEGARGVPPVKIVPVSSERITRSEVDGAIALALRTASSATRTVG